MKPFSKRVLSALLAACMAGTTIPATAMAATLTVQDSAELVTAAETKTTPEITLSDTTVWYGDPVAMTTSVKLGSTTTTEYNGEAGAITYTYVDSQNITQSGTPKDAGTYTVTASIAGNDSYNSATSNTATLTIKASVEKITIGTISDIPYHGAAITAKDLRPFVTVEQSDGKTYTGDISYTTRADGSGNTGYYLPTDAGTYFIKAETPASESKDNTKKVSDEATLTIEPAETTIVKPVLANSDPDEEVYTYVYAYTGSAISFKATAYLNKDDSNYEVDISDKISYSYTGKVNNKSVSGTGLPKDKGSYTVTMTVKGTDNYDGATETASVEIGESVVDLDMEKSYSIPYTGKTVTLSGVKATLNGTTDLTGKISYSYCVQGSSTQKSGLPTEAGTYTVTATVPATSTYAETSKTCTVTVRPADTTVSLPSATTVSYTGKPASSLATAAWNKGDKDYETDCSSLIHYYYRVKASDSWSADLPTDAGTYFVKAEVEGTSNYSEATAEGQLTISMTKATITLPTQTSFTYTGKQIDYTATATAGSESITGIRYEYKNAGAADSTYKTGLPTNVGSYTIKVSLESGSNYTYSPKTANITIAKAKPTVALEDKTTTYNGKPVEMAVDVKLLEDDTYTVTPTYSYKPASASDASYVTVNASTPFPTNAGTYTVKAEVKVAGDQYETVTETAELTIKPIELDIQWTTDCEDGCVHDGKVHTATPSIASTGKILAADKDKLSVTAPNGSQTKAGTYEVKAVFIGDAAANYAATSSTATYQFIISEHPHEFETFTEPATLTKDGAEVTKCILPDCDYVKTSKTIAKPKTMTLSKTAYVYSGKSKNPTVKVYDTDSGRISSSNYTVSYPNGRKVIGTHTVEIEFTGEKYIGTMSAEFVINPPASSIQSLKVGKTYITVGFKAVSGSISGYEIQYATKSSFSNAQTITVSKSRTSKMLKSLKSNQKYYIRIRSYKTVNGKTYRSAWCKTKNITTQKK